MKVKRLFHLSLVTLFVFGVVASGICMASPDETTIVYVDPPYDSAPAGQYFTINVSVTEVTNLNSWFFKLYIKKAVLETNESMIEEGPFLSQNGVHSTELTANYDGIYWRVGCHIATTENSTSGDGTLASITFKVLKDFYCDIALTETRLWDPDVNLISHTSKGGYFSNVRDIAVWDVIAYPIIASVGEPVFINVTVRNQGNETETFDVTANYDNTSIEDQTVTSLNPGTLKTLTITWNTTGVANGTYIISANASILEGEANTDNNRKQFDDSVTLTYNPVAIFTYSPADPLAGETVTFNATASFDPDDNITSYEWDFGDGNTTIATDPITTHVYASADYYTVNLTVTDNNNLTDTELKSIAVGKPNASFTFTPDSPIVGQTVTFNASSSTPRDGIIANYTWDFGDGNVTTVFEQIITHIYESAGTYTVTLNVTDSEGMWDTESKPITVGLSVAPVVTFIFTPESPLIQETVTFNATESTPNGGTIVSYEWNFGDGNITTVTEPTITHIYESAGTYTVTLNVTDSEEKWDTESKPITVKAGPEASFSFSPTTPVVNDIVTFNATASSDPDGTIVGYTWDFGDGNITTVTEPTVTHAYKASGNYTVTLEITDNDDLTDTETKSIEVKVQEKPPNITLYLAVAIAIIALAAVVVYFIKIRKPSS